MLYSRCIEALAWARSLADDRRSTLAPAATSSEAGRKPRILEDVLDPKVDLAGQIFQKHQL